MTTFQDQPLSRRAVRQSERGELSGTDAPSIPQQFAGQQTPDVAGAAAMWDTVSRRAAQLPQQSTDAPPAQGRRSSGAPYPQSGEPLTYTTSGAAPVAAQPPVVPQSPTGVPTYDGPSFRPRRSAAESQPVADQGYRVRDFSPEGRRAAAPTPEQSWPSPPPLSVEPRPAVAEVDLQYSTQASWAPPAAPQPVRPVAPQEQTLTRRELRAMQLQAEAQAALAAAPLVQPSAPELVETLLQSGPIELPLLAPAPQANHALASAMAEFDQLTRGSQVAEPHEDTLPPALVTPPAPPAEPDPAALWAMLADPQLPPAPSAFAQPQQPDPQAMSVPMPTAATINQPSQSERPSWSPPVGHWSTQADLDDETQPYESTINRTIGGTNTATNALVLPSIPAANDLSGALTGTGEILLTGSIDLPRSLASTGTTARIDDDGFDLLIDPSDREVTSTDSAPVRAIRAVSTHNTNGHGVTHTQKPKGTRALTALIISAVTMAVVAVGLLGAAMAFNVF